MGSLVAVVWYILFLSFLSFSFSIVFFCWAERTDFTYYTPHDLCLFFFNHCFGPSVFCPFGSDCPFYLAVQHWTRIFKGIGTLASPNLLVTFLYFYFFEKAEFKKSIVSYRILKPAGMRQTGRRKVGRY